jgi:hypothetical protein
MSKLPQFNGAADMREAIRRTAAELANVEADDLSPYQQAKLITEFIRQQPKSSYRIDHINETRWTAFVVGKTKKPTNFDMLRAAWDWMAEYHDKALKGEYATPVVSSFAESGWLQRLVLEKPEYGEKLDTSLPCFEKKYALFYRHGRDRDLGVVCCELRLENSHSGQMFRIDIPMFNRSGALDVESVTGRIIPNRDTMLFLGVSSKNGMAVFAMAGPIRPSFPQEARGSIMFSDGPYGDMAKKLYVEEAWAHYKRGIMSIQQIKAMETSNQIPKYTTSAIHGALFPRELY